MYIVDLTYKVSLEDIDGHLDEHIAYLNKQFEEGNFLASGRKVPRTGGIILSRVREKDILLEILRNDPFIIHDLADYELTEFMPTKVSKELNFLIE